MLSTFHLGSETFKTENLCLLCNSTFTFFYYQIVSVLLKELEVIFFLFCEMRKRNLKIQSKHNSGLTSLKCLYIKILSVFLIEISLFILKNGKTCKKKGLCPLTPFPKNHFDKMNIKLLLRQ